jgi:hypothetical protein
MTVCIAAITRERLIATTSDTMVSTYLSSTDGSTVKVETIHKDWSAMMAADDMTQCVLIIQRAEKYFRGRANTLQNVRASFKKAYQQHLGERAADIVLGRFSMDMDAFTKSGKRRFTEAQFNTLCAEIRAVKLGCQFLVHGFDEAQQPHIFIVDDPGADSVYDKPGFCSIGSGLYAATGLLYHLGQTVDCDVSQTVFNVLAAKFMAEKSAGIGKETYLFVKKYRCNMFSAASWLIPTTREMWEKSGQPKVPNGAIEAIKTANFRYAAAEYSDERLFQESTVRSS